MWESEKMGVMISLLESLMKEEVYFFQPDVFVKKYHSEWV